MSFRRLHRESLFGFCHLRRRGWVRSNHQSTSLTNSVLAKDTPRHTTGCGVANNITDSFSILPICSLSSCFLPMICLSLRCRPRPCHCHCHCLSLIPRRIGDLQSGPVVCSSSSSSSSPPSFSASCSSQLDTTSCPSYHHTRYWSHLDSSGCLALDI